MNLLCWTAILGQMGAAKPKPGDWQFGWERVGMVAAAATVIAVVIWLIFRLLALRERRVSNSPGVLFKDLATAHGLSHRERQLLRRLAQQYRLEQPAVLFIEAAWWEDERLGPAWAKRLPEIEKLRRRLFAIR
jgi:hypothetical protein